MKQYTISTLHRTLASVLLFSQLLTSCGGVEMISPACTTSQTQQHIGLSDDIPILESSMGSPAPLATPDEQEYASDDSSQSFTSPIYTTRRGHQISLIPKGGQYLAHVQEQLPTGFIAPRYTLPVVFPKDFFPKDLTPDSYVDVVFPRPANGNKGYVFCAERGGLLGGGYICVDDEELKYAISEGYRMLVGREAETLHDWAPFIGSFVGGLSRIDLSLSRISYASSFDPGNTRSTFSRMASQITGRNIHLTNYGEAWTRIVNKARSRIEGERTLPLDPADYPTNSYEIQLRPNARDMRALIGEMDRIYLQTPVGGTVELNFRNILEPMSVQVNFKSSFYAFEREERSREERIKQEREARERQEKETREKQDKATREKHAKEERERQEKEAKERAANEAQERKERGSASHVSDGSIIEDDYKQGYYSL